LSLFPAARRDAELPGRFPLPSLPRKRGREGRGLASRRAPPTFVLRLAIAAAGVFERRLNEAVTSGLHKNNKHAKHIDRGS